MSYNPSSKFMHEVTTRHLAERDRENRALRVELGRITRRLEKADEIVNLAYKALDLTGGDKLFIQTQLLKLTDKYKLNFKRK